METSLRNGEKQGGGAIAGEGELPDEASLEGGDFEAHSKKTKCQEVDPSRRGGLKTEGTSGGLRNGRKIRTARMGEGDGDKSERWVGPLVWEWTASDKVVVKSSGKFRGSKRLSLCWTENGSLADSREGGAAGAETDRGRTISEQKQRLDTRTCP